MRWEKMTLGALCEKYNGKIQTGPFGSSLHQSDYKETGTPVIMPKDIINNRVSLESIARIGDSDTERLAKHKVYIGDIVFPRRGEINKRAFITSDEEGFICGTGCLKISIEHDAINNKYINYYLAREESVSWLENNAVGSTMKNLSGRIISDIPISIPKPDTQHKIASILSAYDDLIENNTKRIKLLEEAAQNIYKEWFVHLRFPGYEKAKIKDGLPVEWRKEPVEKHVDFQRGIEVGSDNYQFEQGTDTIAFIRVGDLSKRDSGIYTRTELVKDKIVFEDDILLSLDGSIGIVKYGMSGAYSTGVRKLVALNTSLSNAFLFCLVTSENIQNTIRAHAKGTTILHAGTSIKYMEFVLPDEKNMKRFNDIAVPLLRQSLLLIKQNKALQEARDILLPRLMNRTIEVGAEMEEMA